MSRTLAGGVHRPVAARRGKLFGTRWGVNLALVLLAVASGCSPSRAVRQLPQGEWLVRLGNARHAAFAAEHVPQSVHVAWDEGMGRGLPATPIVHDDLIISVVSGGGIITASAENGNRYWTRRFNGAVAGQVLRVDDRLFFATQHRNGSVYALTAVRGRRLWSRRLNARATAEPAYAGNRIFVATDRGEMLALDAADGDIIWRTRIGGGGSQPPVVAGEDILIAARDTLVRVARSNGAVRARIPLPGLPSAPLALNGDTVTIAMHPGIVVAFAERGARELWRHDLGAPVLAAPVIASDGVYALTRTAELYRLGPASAVRVAALDGTATESLTVTANGALVGLLDGRVVFVGRDGSRVWEERLNGSVRAPAAVRGSSIFVSTLAGRLVKLTS